MIDFGQYFFFILAILLFKPGRQPNTTQPLTHLLCTGDGGGKASGGKAGSPPPSMFHPQPGCTHSRSPGEERETGRHFLSLAAKLAPCPAPLGGRRGSSSQPLTGKVLHPPGASRPAQEPPLPCAPGPTSPLRPSPDQRLPCRDTDPTGG